MTNARMVKRARFASASATTSLSVSSNITIVMKSRPNRFGMMVTITRAIWLGVMRKGYFWFEAESRVIKSSGYRIGPFEVENALMTHPAVVECAITGVPDQSVVWLSSYRRTEG